MKILVGLFLALLVGVGVYVIYHNRPPAPFNPTQNIQLKTEVNCLLDERVCTASDDQSQISLSFNPKPVPLMQPVQTVLTVTGFKELTAAHLKIEGLNMYMGFQAVELTKQAADGSWQGSFSLPICSESQMQWLVTATLSSAEQTSQTTFQFNTHR